MLLHSTSNPDGVVTVYIGSSATGVASNGLFLTTQQTCSQRNMTAAIATHEDTDSIPASRKYRSISRNILCLAAAYPIIMQNTDIMHAAAAMMTPNTSTTVIVVVIVQQFP